MEGARPLRPARPGPWRGVVRHHPEHLDLGRRAGRDDGFPRAQVPARAPQAAPGGRSPRRAGTTVGEPRIQQCDDCGTLRHPPGPRCPSCGNLTPGYVVAAGTGEVYSYVVHHHPPLPGKKLPIVIALVELLEGVRMIGELLGVEPDQARIGLPVRAEFVRIDDDLTLPAVRSRAGVACRSTRTAASSARRTSTA